MFICNILRRCQLVIQPRDTDAATIGAMAAADELAAVCSVRRRIVQTSTKSARWITTTSRQDESTTPRTGLDAAGWTTQKRRCFVSAASIGYTETEA